MPGIEIREYDKTGKSLIDYSNFAVVVPGFVKESGFDNIADENGVYECTSINDFKNNIGYIETTDHLGNQIAYILLGLGYTVLYKQIKLESGETVINKLKESGFWNPLKDKSAYNFRYIISGLDASKSDVDINKQIATLANYLNKKRGEDINGRGDCIALLDLPDNSIDGIKSLVNSSYSTHEFNKYSMFITPSISYNLESIKEIIGDFEYKNYKFPGSFHYLACAAKAFNSYNEWYAVAGFDRGVCDFEILGATVKFGESAVKAFEPRFNNGICKAVNPIINIRGNYYIWGNRTAENLLSEDKDLRASHFLNIRQLCTTLKKELYIICRKFTFDPNSDVLWINFTTAIKPLLEKMKADQGISDYKIIKVKTQDKAKLCATLRIVPIEAVEDFEIDLYLEDSISGTTVGIDEE